MKADFTAHQQMTTKESAQEWIRWANMEARARGISWVRVSCPPENTLELWFEGWLIKPDDQGPKPWQ